MKSTNPNRGSGYNGLAPRGSSCAYDAVNDKKYNALVEQISQLQEDLVILSKQVNDFGSSFNTASASITKLVSDDITSKKGTITSLDVDTIKSKFEKRGYYDTISSEPVALLGTFRKGNADFDIVTTAGNEAPQYIKISILGDNVIVRSTNPTIVDNLYLQSLGTLSQIAFTKAVAGDVTYYVHANAEAYAIDKTIEPDSHIDFVLDNQTTITGKLNIDNTQVLNFANVHIDDLTANNINGVELFNTITASIDELTSLNANITNATISDLKATLANIEDITATTVTSEVGDIGHIISDDIDNKNKITTKDFEAANAKITGLLNAGSISLDKSIQLPEISDIEKVEAVFSLTSGIIMGTLNDASGVLATFTAIKDTTVYSNVLVSYSQKTADVIYEFGETKDGEFAFTTDLSGLTLHYGTYSLSPDEVVVTTYKNPNEALRLSHFANKTQHTIILGNHRSDYGIAVDGAVQADLLPLPGTTAFEDLDVSNTLNVGGKSTLKDVFVDGTLTVTGATDLRSDTKVTGNTTLNGDLQVNGDIVQSGDFYETHVEKVFSKNDMIITREGAVGALPEYSLTGITAEKYDGVDNGVLAFDKEGTARVGDEGFVLGPDGNPAIDENGNKILKAQALATRAEEADMVNGNAVAWDAVNKRLVTPKAVTVDGHLLARTDDALMLYGSEGMDNIPEGSLDTVVKCSQYSADDGLANKITEKPENEEGAFDLIVGYFNSDSSLPYQIYINKLSQNAYYRMTIDGLYDIWHKVADDRDIKALNDLINTTLTEKITALEAADAAIIDGTTPVQKVALDATDAKGDKLATVKDVRTASWVGTKAKFDADKEIKDPDSKDFIADGTLINLLDDPSDTLNLSNSVTEGDLQPVTSNAVALYDPTPVGTIIYSVAKKEPKGYLRCDGREISSTQYPELYSVLEFSFDPEGKRCLLPNQLTADGKPRALYGADNGTYKVGTYIEESLPNHSHTYTDPGHIHGMKAQGATTSGSGGTFNVQEGDFDTTTNAKTNITIDGVDNVYNALGEKIENTVYKDNANVFSNGIAVNMFIKF